MLDDVTADIRRFTGREPTALVKVGVLLFNPGLQAVLLYRMSRWFHLHGMRGVAIALSYFNAALTGAQISPRASIGKGLAIYHPHGTVIGATAIIGDNCTLTHGNVIGQAYGDDDRPIIGDHFYAGSGAKLFGKITIGNGVRVGANAVVISSLPDRTTAIASPAKILFRRGSELSAGQLPISFTSSDTVVQRLVSLLKNTVNLREMDSITESTALLGEGVGLDSLETLTVLGAIEEEFQLTIAESELEVSHFKTVGSLAAFIQARLSPGCTGPS